MNFEPIHEPFTTIQGELSGTVTAGDAVEVDGSGEWARATGATTTMVGVAAADGVDGDVISIYVEGTFKTTIDSGTAMIVGDLCALKDHTDVDDGTTGDLALQVMGPSKSNANAATVWVKFHPLNKLIL